MTAPEMGEIVLHGEMVVIGAAVGRDGAEPDEVAIVITAKGKRALREVAPYHYAIEAALKGDGHE